MPQQHKSITEWSNQEIDLLTQLYPKFVSKKWKNIAKQFKKKGFARNQSDCRQKWTNFVDPRINAQEWTDDQLIILYQNYEKFGSRWSLVQRNLQGRTQNKIKNRFYGTLRNMLRFILQKHNKGSASYTQLISKLSPLTLNSLYRGTENFSFLKGEIKETVKQMQYKMDKSFLNQKVKAHRETYSNLNKQMMVIFQKIKKKQEDEENLSQVGGDQQHIQQANQLQPQNKQPLQEQGDPTYNNQTQNNVQAFHPQNNQQNNQINQNSVNNNFDLDANNNPSENRSLTYDGSSTFSYPFFYIYYPSQ